MFSLRLPIPIENTLTPPPKANNINNLSHCSNSYACSSYSRNQAHRFLTVMKLGGGGGATSAPPPPPNVALRDDGASVAGESLEPVPEPLPEELKAELMPKHVAVIMDGNGRWAKMRGLMPSAGHQAGVQALREMVRLCWSWGIKVLTIFAFSTDNWVRPKVSIVISFMAQNGV